MLILNIQEEDKRKIKGGHRELLIQKLKQESDKWRKNVLLGKEDHRFNQGIYCTLLDVLEILE